MAENKTQKNDKSVEEFLNNIQDEKKRNESFVLLDLMRKVTTSEPVMWGENIVGFGDYHYKYASGREGDWALMGFSPRKTSFSIYTMPGASYMKPVLENLGKYKTGVGCLYVNKLDDIDINVLEEFLVKSHKIAKKYKAEKKNES